MPAHCSRPVNSQSRSVSRISGLDCFLEQMLNENLRAGTDQALFCRGVLSGHACSAGLEALKKSGHPLPQPSRLGSGPKGDQTPAERECKRTVAQAIFAQLPTPVCGLINVGQAFSPVHCACVENRQARMPVLLVTRGFLVK